MAPRGARSIISVEDTEQYQYVLQNFRIAHEKVEEQRVQLEEQERQVAQLRARIELLEGGSGLQMPGGNSVDDFSIKNEALQLDKLINRFASEIIRQPPTPIEIICEAALNDIVSGAEAAAVFTGTPMQVQCLLRHAISEVVSEGFINCLIVTNSKEANIQLTRIHEHIFARKARFSLEFSNLFAAGDPTVASVWRRQTFSAAVNTCTPEMAHSILTEQIPHLTQLLLDLLPSTVIDSAYHFSRMLHGTAGSGDAFYRAFVPEIGSTLLPRQIELVKRCLKNERGEIDRVGCTMFPGLVKVSLDNAQTVVRRAQVICECAMNSTGR
ncbi:Pentafunctional AROM polypeptide [Mycena sanguinolenta]|uniref:Pentafunctional AROM polypeptide n=1 Tax=Mycena sanguinolenta TaxID=230812 RepID=A0A8H6ZBL1_9AGAR|nr:Pentafunctional AROM polypeptide [Mycena sanguinolenta]